MEALGRYWASIGEYLVIFGKYLASSFELKYWYVKKNIAENDSFFIIKENKQIFQNWLIMIHQLHI